jgi:hypothetical protein
MPTAAAAAAPAPAADVLGDFVMDLEDSLGDDFTLGKPPAPAARPVVSTPAPPPVTIGAAAAPAPAMATPVPVPAPAPVAVGGDTGSVLSDIFDEFKEDVEQTSGEAEDPDTHYNLGVAFKEMGLLDEAIGELQKVCQAIEQGHPFAQVIQAYTWLAHCFVEKGVPQAGIKWYEKALKTPGVDEESRMAMYYELGSAHESAGNKQAALNSFMEVYGSNIDYRDVAERIKSLKS